MEWGDVHLHFQVKGKMLSALKKKEYLLITYRTLLNKEYWQAMGRVRINWRFSIMAIQFLQTPIFSFRVAKEEQNRLSW